MQRFILTVTAGCLLALSPAQQRRPGWSAAPVRTEGGIAEVLGADRRRTPNWRRSRAASVSPKAPFGIRKGFLYISDEEKNRLSRVYPDGRVETVLEIGDPDGSTLDAKGRLVTTASVLRAIIQVDPDGKYKVLADDSRGRS